MLCQISVEIVIVWVWKNNAIGFKCIVLHEREELCHLIRCLVLCLTWEYAFWRLNGEVDRTIGIVYHLFRYWLTCCLCPSVCNSGKPKPHKPPLRVCTRFLYALKTQDVFAITDYGKPHTDSGEYVLLLYATSILIDKKGFH